MNVSSGPIWIPWCSMENAALQNPDASSTHSWNTCQSVRSNLVRPNGYSLVLELDFVYENLCERPYARS